MKYFLAGLLFVSITQAFQVKNGQAILEKLDDYQKCHTLNSDGQHCHDALERWVEKHPDDSFQAGKLTRLKMNHQAAVPFFLKAFENKKADCKDADVWMAIAAALKLPSQNKILIEAANKIAFNHCLKEFKEDLLELIDANEYAKDNLCPEVKKRKIAKPSCP